MATLSTILNNPTIPDDPTPRLSIVAPRNVDYYYIFDGDTGVLSDFTDEANEDTVNDAPLLPASVTTSGAAHYVGGIKLFSAILYEVGTAGGGTYTGAFGYSTSVGFSVLPDYFGSIADLDNFKVAERVGVFLLPPTDFEPRIVNGQLAYWVRYNITVIGSGYAQPLANRIRLYPPVTGGGLVMRCQTE